MSLYRFVPYVPPVRLSTRLNRIKVASLDNLATALTARLGKHSPLKPSVDVHIVSVKYTDKDTERDISVHTIVFSQKVSLASPQLSELSTEYFIQRVGSHGLSITGDKRDCYVFVSKVLTAMSWLPGAVGHISYK